MQHHSLFFWQSSYIGLHEKPLVKLSGSNPELIELFSYLNFLDWRITCCNHLKMLFLAKVASYCTSAFLTLSSVAVIDRMLLIVQKVNHTAHTKIHGRTFCDKLLISIHSLDLIKHEQYNVRWFHYWWSSSANIQFSDSIC